MSESKLLSESTRRFWLEASRQGSPPTIVEVARKQYDLMAPWHVRKFVWSELRGLGRWPGKRKRARIMSRDTGKSYAIGSTVLYAAEYLIPFIPGLRFENRRVNVIGRDTTHLAAENMETIENLICNHAPWLKSADPSHWDDPGALKEMTIKTGRTWHKTQKDLTNGVSIRGYAFTQSPRGSHVPLSVADDFIDEEIAHFGEEHFEKLNSAFMPSVVNGGLFLAVGTPIDDRDVWRFMSEEPEWDFKSFPAFDEREPIEPGSTKAPLDYRAHNEQDIDDGYLPPESIKKPEDLHCLWPYRLNYDSLMAARGSTPRSELSFLREYMMKRAAAWNLLVHPDYFRAAKRDDVCYQFSTEGVPTFMGVDPSTLRRSNFVMWVGTKVPVRDQSNAVHHYAIRLLYREMIEIQENENPQTRKQRLLQAFDRLRAVFTRYNPRKIVIEGNAFQNFIEPYLEDRDARLRGRIEQVSLTTNKHLDDGWPMIRSVFEAGHVELPYGPTPNEIERFKRGEIEPKDFEARRITDSFWEELKAVKYLNATIVEDETQQRDQVAAFYFLLRAADYVPPSVGVHGVPLDKKEDAPAQRGIPRRLDAELNRNRVAQGPFSQLQKAQRFLRR